MGKNKLDEELKKDGIKPLPELDNETLSFMRSLLSLGIALNDSEKTTYTQCDAHRDYLLIKSVTGMRIKVHDTANKEFPLALEFSKTNTSCGFRYISLLKVILNELQHHNIIHPEPTHKTPTPATSQPALTETIVTHRG